MITQLVNNLVAFILSVPINLVIIGVVCLVLKIIGKSFKTIIRVFAGYFLICFALSILGLSLPSIPALILWLKEVFISLGLWLKGLGIL